MKKYEILVTAKKGIFDPAGETSKTALFALGYEGVSNVSIGKYIELDVEDSVTTTQVEEMCKKLLSNPVIEDYLIKNV